MTIDNLTQDAVLRIGEVNAVEGRRIYVLVDKNKNLSDLFLDGDVLKNISVNSYVEIRKGFLSIIGRVEGEKIQEDFQPKDEEHQNFLNKNKRILTISLTGYIDENGGFTGGTKELPLIGNEAYVVTREKIHIIHNLVRDDSPSINIATIYGDDLEIDFPVDGLFNSHIAIFGNTGSGKSNTLAHLYQELVRTLTKRNPQSFVDNAHFVLFDFNGEYSTEECISESKTVYNLSTQNGNADKLPLHEDGLLDIEILAILSDATDKTQKPFLKRMLRFYKNICGPDSADPEEHIKNILRKRVTDILQMTDKFQAFLLIDYLREILPDQDSDGDPIDIVNDLDWHNKHAEFYIKADGTFLSSNPERISDTFLYGHVNEFFLDDSIVVRLILFLYLQLIFDVISNRAQNDHIAPVINRMKSKRYDIDKLFDLSGTEEFWSSNFIVVNLDDVNLDMKKTIPLLLSKKLYSEHKSAGSEKTLNIIIDEAHNILSTESFREVESWKDYRLETFEEIIKEGRKFGVFITISSQRPNDISPTITSQAHNYFIHRLINHRDLMSIANAVSYIDRITEESIPTLPTGTCIFSGVASQMPLKINVKLLGAGAIPQSGTRKFGEIVPKLETEED